MIQRTGAGTFGETAATGSGSSRMIAASTSGRVSPANARRPVAIS